MRRYHARLLWGLEGGWANQSVQRPPRHPGQTWATFLHNHAADVWACDFLPITDLLFRPLYAFFVVELGSRRVVHVGMTHHPTDTWAAQQLHEATPFGTAPRYLIGDNDSTFGPSLARVAQTRGIDVLRTADQAPKMNAIWERFLGSVRREFLDQLLILGEAHLRHTLCEYSRYVNAARPHQGMQQRTPMPYGLIQAQVISGGQETVRAIPILGGLHHDYQRTA